MNVLIEQVKKELAVYTSPPYCMDCKWGENTSLTDNCSCMGDRANPLIHQLAFKHARTLQALLRQLEQGDAIYLY